MKAKYCFFLFIFISFIFLSCVTSVKEFYENINSREDGFDYVIYNGSSSELRNNRGYDIVIDSKKRIVICGELYNENKSNLIVWRFDEDGSLDKSFNNKGYFVFNKSENVNNYDSGYSVTVDKNDKILITGVSDSNLLIIKLNTNGSYDKTFNKKGYLICNMDNYTTTTGKDIIYSNDNKIYITGFGYNHNNNYDMILWRYDYNGNIDETFNYNGYVIHDNAAGGRSHDYGYAAVLTSDNKIVITGSSFNKQNNTDMVVWQYNSYGDLDRSFNKGKGYYVFNNHSNQISDESGHSIKIDKSGKIIISGTSLSTMKNYEANVFLWILNNNGTPYRSLNRNGNMLVNKVFSEKRNNIITGIDLDSNNNIYLHAFGELKNLKGSASSLNMLIWRLNDNGIIDDTFYSAIDYNNGKYIGSDKSDNFPKAMILDNSNKIFITGYCPDSKNQENVFIWCINNK